MSVSGDNMTREQRLYTKALAQADERIASLQKRIAELETALAQSNAEPQALRDAAENLLIAIGMGWDIEGCVENLRNVLAQSDPLPRQHQDPSKWPTRETVERAHTLAQSDAEPICKICGGSGYTRHLGRDNSEEVENCSCRQQSDAEPVAWLVEAAEFTDQMFSLAFDITPIESCEIMELGEKLGLLEQVAYNPKIHEGEIDADEGEMIYVRSAKGKAVRARATNRS